MRQTKISSLEIGHATLLTNGIVRLDGLLKGKNNKNTGKSTPWHPCYIATDLPRLPVIAAISSFGESQAVLCDAIVVFKYD